MSGGLILLVAFPRAARSIW